MPASKNKGGRPPIEVIDSREASRNEVDLKMLDALCQLRATQAEIASQFRITPKSLQNLAKKDPRVKEIMEQAPLRGKISLRRKLFTEAMKGNTAALIFACKNHLDMSDRVANEHSGPDGKPIEVKNTSTDTAIIDEFLVMVEKAKIGGLHEEQAATSEHTERAAEG